MEIKANPYDSGAGETYSEGVGWFADCYLCGWAGEDRASRGWATRDGNAHVETDEHMMNDVHESRSTRRG